MHTVSSGIVPNSNAVAFPTAGTYYWQAIYSGDANNSAATSSCMSEILTVNPIVVPPGMATTTLTNTLSTTSIMVGGTAFDTAFLTNSTSSATGTVAYTVYTDSACTAGALNVGTKNVTGGIVPSSNVSLFNATGTYYYRAVYSGDAHNTAASTTCGAAILTVSAAPLPPIMMATTTLTNTLSTTSIMVGGTAYDTAILSNSTSSAGGTVNYSIYSDSSCNVLLQNVGSKTVTAGMVPNSNTASFGFPGTYYWRAVYSGDPHNTGATTTCGAAILTVLAMGSTTPPVAGAGSISGVIFNDLNKDEERDAGENGLSGWTVHLLKVVRHHHWKWHNKHWNDMWTESTTTHMTTISDANGYYVFPNLTPGKYVVSEDVMSNWEQTTELDPVIVTATSAETVDIGNVQKKMHHQGWWWGSGQWHNGDEDSSNNDESDNNGDSNNNNQWEWQTTYGGKFPFQSHAFDWFMGRSNQ